MAKNAAIRTGVSQAIEDTERGGIAWLPLGPRRAEALYPPVLHTTVGQAHPAPCRPFELGASHV